MPIILGAVLLVGLGVALGNTDDSDRPEGAGNTAQQATTAPAPAEPKLSVEEQNAIGSARSFLATSPFSRTGLIQQLKFEGYPEQTATKAVDSLGIDYEEQAAESARNYLDTSSFSRTGLIGQLTSDGFTQEQATDGVDQVM
ncbi:hypothetical protein FHR83_001967 [Actinoplanes campanulatus]|uniref:Putative host cell surface-exposed lipoprotein Ltp-like HTH region domain-containing protein n=1 Tax=Actinoplanes campanulatus TaxID=113559 RepID=A0A7W5FDG8_9ACTN|nr:Ltp family lipoprotein [Actinoplanes campanulatus]MBB3094315.1 hypothetical protein [Actinoplanes campanulatus]